MFVKGNQVSYNEADSILLEPWGGTGGSEWNYMLKSPIKEILIAHGDVIDSIMFITITEQGTTIDSPKFGGDGGRRDKVVIEATPLKYLIGIKRTFGRFYGHSVIKSLCFITNAKNYGPFGSEAVGTPFLLVMKEGVAIAGNLLLPLQQRNIWLKYDDTFNVLDFIESIKNEENQKVVDVDLTEKLKLELDFLLLNEIGKYWTCQIHDLVHDFCLIKAREEKLFDWIRYSSALSSLSRLSRFLDWTP
uniref:Jacalin-type lectin domain-containing protein n=1 Tax=Nicotiana tabacum TaxID=4097 RepID=A0A1S3XR24_TOBAC|nr:PREDICTED: uncharacterized protein LOC107767755 [Nicotiana tabacum]